MNKRSVIKVFLATGMVALLAACGKNASPSSDSSMKVVNLGVDLGAVNAVYDDGGNKSFASNVARETASTYATVKGGSRNYTVTAVTGGGTLFQQAISATAGAKFSLIVYGNIASPRAMILQDDNIVQPDAGKFRLRVAVPAVGLDVLDVYVTTPGADISTLSPSFPSVANAAVSAIADFAMGATQIRATIAGTKTLVYDGGTTTFADKDRFTLAIYTAGSSKLANGALMKIDDAGTFSLVRNGLGRYRFVNANASYPLVNLLFNNAIALSNVPYRGASGYVVAGTAARALTVSPSNTPGTNIYANAAFSLTSAQDSSIMLVGDLNTRDAVVLPDTTLPSPTNKARVRFVNGSIGTGAVDVFVSFQITAGALAERSASAYFDYDANTYDMSVSRAGGTQLFALPGVILAAGKVYTVFVLGPPSNVQGVLVQDN